MTQQNLTYIPNSNLDRPYSFLATSMLTLSKEVAFSLFKFSLHWHSSYAKRPQRKRIILYQQQD